MSPGLRGEGEEQRTTRIPVQHEPRHAHPDHEVSPPPDHPPAGQLDFSDQQHERNALHAKVWPKRYCQQRGFTFQAIDLRWGVPAEAALDHSHDGDLLRGTETIAEDFARTDSPEGRDCAQLNDETGNLILRRTIVRKFLELRGGIPSHDTFRRVFGLLDRKQFAACLLPALRVALGLERADDQSNSQGTFSPF